MRSIEALLLLANLLTFFVVALPLPSAVRWTGYLAVLSLLIAITQVLIEGPRWQMVPAYVLSTLLSFIWLLGIVSPGGIQVNRLASILGVGVGVVVLAIPIALPILMPVFRFPKPTGPYAIGTLTYHWVDSSRPELFTADPSDQRELLAQVWYPAKNDPSAPRAPYIEDADGVTPAIGRLLHLPGFDHACTLGISLGGMDAAEACLKDPRPSLPHYGCLDAY